MKLEYIADGSPYCPLIRLYEFTDIETAGLRTKVAELAQGSSISIALHDLNFVTPIGNCELILIVADDGQGILAINTFKFKKRHLYIFPFTYLKRSFKCSCPTQVLACSSSFIIL